MLPVHRVFAVAVPSLVFVLACEPNEGTEQPDTAADSETDATETDTDESTSDGSTSEDSSSEDSSTETETETESSTDESETTTDESSSEVSSEDTTDTGGDDPRVLFVGNSYTAGGNLAMMVADMTASAGMPIEIGTVIVGGQTVEGHVASQQLADQLMVSWDQVVIQGQSFEPIVQPQVFEDAVVELSMMIGDAELLLFETWAREEGHPLLADLGMTQQQMQDGLTDGYASAAQASGGTVVPVGQTWMLALQAEPDITLYSGDGSHRSLAGSFLAACGFYRALTGLDAATNDFVPDGLDPADADALELVADSL